MISSVRPVSLSVFQHATATHVFTGFLYGQIMHFFQIKIGFMCLIPVHFPLSAKYSIKDSYAHEI